MEGIYLFVSVSIISLVDRIEAVIHNPSNLKIVANFEQELNNFLYNTLRNHLDNLNIPVQYIFPLIDDFSGMIKDLAYEPDPHPEHPADYYARDIHNQILNSFRSLFDATIVLMTEVGDNTDTEEDLDGFKSLSRYGG